MVEIVEEVLNVLENNYGAQIERIVKCDEYKDHFVFTVIFTDYTLLEAKVHIQRTFNMPSINIEGIYY
jgi:hypothetical protein